MSTLTLILLLLFGTCVTVLAWDSYKRSSRRREREMIRRIHRYLATMPPRSPW